MKAYALSTMPVVNIRLFHSRKKMRKVLAKDGIEAELDKSDGLTVSYLSDSGPVSVVLCPFKDVTPKTLALLTHEASHVVDYYMEYLGEDKPSGEFKAYVTQAVNRWLLEEHLGVGHE